MSQGVRLDPRELGLPHREPFVFVDVILEHVPGQSAIGEKTFSAADPMFAGHFPCEPVVPGVILVEALAQTAGIAVGTHGERLYLTAIKGVKFPSPCFPEERITLTATKAAGVDRLIQCNVTAQVGSRAVAEGVIVLASANPA